jgi:hypothetical protein
MKEYAIGIPNRNSASLPQRGEHGESQNTGLSMNVDNSVIQFRSRITITRKHVSSQRFQWRTGGKEGREGGRQGGRGYNMTINDHTENHTAHVYIVLLKSIQLGQHKLNGPRRRSCSKLSFTDRSQPSREVDNRISPVELTLPGVS